jgi:hypothetical protein
MDRRISKKGAAQFLAYGSHHIVVRIREPSNSEGTRAASLAVSNLNRDYRSSHHTRCSENWAAGSRKKPGSGSQLVGEGKYGPP